ncbi:MULTISPECIES: DEAD/DEAH box helicase [Rhodomicrobium]|uniref:DEAD/DEAH box helicase n=1 Tax=Rhodomicrobium TaxID=1068 RepID=UPI000B4A8CBC|nr:MULTISPECIES: DEAD/DEAH box helicase [Rhodomicrobium]
MTFTNLGLSQKVLDATVAAGFNTPTPIQLQAIPAANEGRDIVGIAQTGTGKTASFVLPMLTRLETGRARARMPRSLILEPTRELAAQVAQAFEQLGVNHKLNVALLIGGVSFDEQNRKLDRGADVLIATPGRLLDHFGRGRLLLSAVEILVIDEGDRMLDMGFIPDIEKICSTLPTNRQTMFYSATMPKEVQKLADKFLINPKRIEVGQVSSAATTIIQRLKFSPSDIKVKREVLRDLINVSGVKNAIIFCNRKRDVGILLKSLLKHGYNAGGLHGDMEQRDRTATLDAFRRGDIALLAASDVAARGLDIPDVSHIFNFDVPITPEDYVHRIGRTGRAGREGYAATLVTPSDMDAIRAIEKLCREKIEWIDGEPSPEALEEARGLGGRRGGRSRRGASSDKPERAGRERSASRGSGRERNGAAPRAERPERAEQPERAEAAPRAEKAERSETPRSSRRDRADAPARGERRERTPRAEPREQQAEAAPRNEPRAPREHNGRGRGNHGAPQPTPNTVVTSTDRMAPPHRERSRRREKEEPSVVGLGEHVPAFLMTPIRRTK